MKRAGELLSAFFDDGVLQKAQGYHGLFSCWQSVAGEHLAAHSRIRELERSVLLVEADHPGWIQILQTKEKFLLDDICRRFPELAITGISFRLSRIPGEIQMEPVNQTGPEEKARSAGEDAPPPPLEKAAPETDITGDPYRNIKDEGLRDIFKRLEQNISAKERNERL